MSIQQGETILNGKYRILRLIGEGGMARVWLAEEVTYGDRRVAIKEPKRFAVGFSDPELRRRFEQEILIAKMLQSAHASHVALAYTVEKYGGTRLLVMPYMAGRSLKERLKQHPDGLNWEEAVRIAKQVLQGLAALHELDIVHRDVKPSNILFDKREEAYLADFGVAQVRGMTVGRTEMLGGPHPGDPAYAAPEQMGNDGGYLAPAADIYALGCVLFEMLIGKRYKRFRPGTRPGDIRNDIPEWLDDLVGRALMQTPFKRWPNAEAMKTTLQQHISERRRSMLWMIPLVILVVGAVLLSARGRKPAHSSAINLTPVVQNTSIFQAIAPIEINGIAYAVPSSNSVGCIASEQTGYTNERHRYNLRVPPGWVIVWDSWKAYWVNGSYESDGLLVIYGPWEGEITVVNGEYCATPVEWADFAINNRRDANPKPNRQEFILGSPP